MTTLAYARLARVLHRPLAEHGLLSFLSLLRAFRLHVIKRNQAPLTSPYMSHETALGGGDRYRRIAV